jgi:NAD(P) transhydrogenase subunit alpha
LWGALLAVNMEATPFAMGLGLLALVLAGINVVGGYLVTDRMLAMFKSKGDRK